MLQEILAQEYPKQETLKDGTKVSIRPLEADDVEALYAFSSRSRARTASS